MAGQLRSALLAGGSLWACASGALAQAAQTPAPPAAPPPETVSAADATASDATQEVVVVGSQIRSARTTGALPVTVVGEKEITATGAVSGDELFRSIPQAGDVQFQAARTTGNLNDARGDTASINLRSLGTGNTLALLNGRRVVFAPGTQTENFVPVQTVNTNSIPVAGIGRIEVLRDGAAAIYGTDAVAGVVNIVLDDHFQGLQVGAQYGGADDYQEGTVTLKAGAKLSDGTRVTLFADYTKHSALDASARDYSASEDHRNVGQDPLFAADTGFDLRSTSSPWGAFTVLPTSTVVRQGTTALTSSGVFHVEPTGNTAAGCSSQPYGPGNICLRSGSITGAADRVLRFDEGPYRSLEGDVARYNLFGTISHDFGWAEAFGELGYYHADFDGSREQSAPLSTAPITIAADAYWNPFGPVGGPNRLPGLTGVPAAGLPLSLTNYRPVDAGPRPYSVSDDTVRLLAGLRGTWRGWSWESAASASAAKTDDTTHNAVSNTLFQAAINRTTPDAYNPFNGGGQPYFSGPDGTLNSAATIRSFTTDVHRVSYTSLSTWDAKISRPDLIHIWAGDVGLATGVEVRHETYTDHRDPRLNGTIKYTDGVTKITYGTDVVGASGAPNVDADRTVGSAFAELAIPLLSPEMNIPLVKSVDLQVAARDEDYSDFGNVVKPKVAGIWKLVDGLSLRGSYSEGFRAPNLPQFYSDGTNVNNSRIDYAFCRLNNTPCTGLSTVEVRSGNKGLQPENAKESSVGVVLQPGFVPSRFGKFTVTVDAWRIAETGVIGIEDAPTQILYDLLLRQNGSSNAAVVRLPAAAGQAVGAIAYINEVYSNLEPRQVSGIDYTADWVLRTDRFGLFDVELNAAQLTKFQQAPDAVQRQVIAANNAGKFGPGIAYTSVGNQIKILDNPRWRAAGTLTWTAGAWQLGAFIQYIGPVFDTTPLQENGQFFKVREQFLQNYYVQYTVEHGGLARGTTLRVGVRNLGDRDPPLAAINVGYLGQLSEPIGRYGYVSLVKRF